MTVFPLLLLAGALAVDSAPSSPPAGTLRVERVFGPEVPTGPYKHPASITELENGDLFLVYYGGQGEYAVDTGVFGARLKKASTKWTQPRLLAHDPFRSLGNGVVWQAPEGLVWIFYVVRWGDTWSTSRIQAKVSRDGGRTWSEGRDCAFPNPNAAVDFLKLRSGHLLLIYNDSMNDRTPLTAALSTDEDRAWPHRRNIATGPYDYAYPFAIQTRDGKIHMVYTSHERTVIEHAVFDEAWVEGK